MLEFELALTKFIAVTSPFAKAIKCLESTHSTLADIYLFWLAVTAQLSYLFSDNRSRLPLQTQEAIRQITNRRFKGMIDDAPEDVYITAFFLDPRKQSLSDLNGLLISPIIGSGYRNAPVFTNLNPLAPKVTVPRANAKQNPGSAVASTSIMRRVGLCLQRLLKNEFPAAALGLKNEELRAIMQGQNPFLAHCGSAAIALTSLREELKAYAKGEEPFDRAVREGQRTREWWVKVQKSDDAHILGVSNLFCRRRQAQY